MTRQRLPNRRECETYEFERDKLKYTISYGRPHHGGPVRELFINAGKSGTNMESLMCDASTAISVALQNGATPQELAHSITRNPDGTPASPIGQILDDMVMG